MVVKLTVDISKKDIKFIKNIITDDIDFNKYIADIIKVHCDQIRKMKKKCPYYNGEFCTASFYEQSFCIKTCTECQYTLEDYKKYEIHYPHLFNK